MTFLRDGDVRALEGHREIPAVNSFHPFFPGKKEWNENIVFGALIEATTHGCR